MIHCFYMLIYQGKLSANMLTFSKVFLSQLRISVNRINLMSDGGLNKTIT